MKRVLTPEWIDLLPATDPRVVRSRRDLLRLNRINHSDALMAGLLRQISTHQSPRILTDLGSGDGLFILHLARRLVSQWPNVNVRLLDSQPSVTAETLAAFRKLGWQAEVLAADLSVALALPSDGDSHVVTANLFLHHFDDEQLRAMFQRVAEHAFAFVAIEPRRGPAQHFFSRWLWVLGCGAATRHDGPSSVRAGFRDREISALWPAGDEWKLDERNFGPFSHTFVAQRLQ